MSNRKASENGAHRKSKVSLAMTINQGLGGPKVNPKGVADGQSVNIPILRYHFPKATKGSSLGELLDSRSLHKEKSKCSGDCLLRGIRFKWASFLEKLWGKKNGAGSVPKTDTGG